MHSAWQVRASAAPSEAGARPAVSSSACADSPTATVDPGQPHCVSAPLCGAHKPMACGAVLGRQPRAEQVKEAKGHRTHFAALASQHVGGERTVAAAAAAATRRLADAAPGAGACARTLLIIQALAAQKGQINAAASAARRCASGPCS